MEENKLDCHDAPSVVALAQCLAAALQRRAGGRWESSVAESQRQSGNVTRANFRVQGKLGGYGTLSLEEEALTALEQLTPAGIKGDALASEWLNSALEEWDQIRGDQRSQVDPESVATTLQDTQCAVTFSHEDGRTLVAQLAFDAALAAAMQRAKQLDSANAPQEVVESPNLNLVLDVELGVVLRFGQRQLSLREVLDLTSGSVIELDRQVEEPVELLLEGKVIARGEAVVVDGNYGLRVTEVPQPISQVILT